MKEFGLVYVDSRYSLWFTRLQLKKILKQAKKGQSKIRLDKKFVYFFSSIKNYHILWPSSLKGKIDILVVDTYSHSLTEKPMTWHVSNYLSSIHLFIIYFYSNLIHNKRENIWECPHKSREIYIYIYIFSSNSRVLFLTNTYHSFNAFSLSISNNICNQNLHSKIWKVVREILRVSFPYW